MTENNNVPENIYYVRFDADWDWHDRYAPSMSVSWGQFQVTWDWYSIQTRAYPDGRCVPEDPDVINRMEDAGRSTLQISRFETEYVALCDVLEAIDGYTSWQEWMRRNEEELPF